jgi:excisionase family DNA binding protein
LSTSEAARLAGVTPSTMKRWADEGRIVCERTAGGHRRFRRSALEEFTCGATAKGVVDEQLDSWLTDLVDASHHTVVSRLFALREETGSWSGVADDLRPVLETLGAAWATGKITIAEEHLASECLSRALGQVGLSLPTRRSPKRALLATAQGERHEMGLRLAELCLRSRQWRSVWLGSNTPTDVLSKHLQTSEIDLVVLTASPWMQDVSSLGRIATRLSHICAAQQASLVLGGGAPWPEVPGSARIVCYQEFDILLSALG